MRILIVAPHADDEVLGCGGLIARRSREGHEVDIAVATLGGLADGRRHDETDVRRGELFRAAEILGAHEPTVLLPGRDGRLDAFPSYDLVSRLDALLEERRYDEVYFCYPSHHQDHRAVHAACLSALRPKGGHEPRRVALYEYPCVGWSPVGANAGRWYVDISQVLPEKEAALRAYETQLREPPHPMSWESAEALARMRGVECGRRHAELFYVLRFVE